MSSRPPASGHTRRTFLRNAGVGAGALTVAGAWSSTNALAESEAASAPPLVGLNDRFDLWAGSPTGLAVIEQAQAIGARTVRFPVRWDTVEIESKLFDWSLYDPILQQLAWSGLGALPVLVGCPPWLGDEDFGTTPTGLAYPRSDGALNAFGEFAVEVADRFSRFGSRIDAIEVWSEPNNSDGPQIADPAEFSRMLATVAMFVGAGNDARRWRSAKTVVSGGLFAAEAEGAWVQYLHGFNNQWLPYAVGLHIYPPAQPKATDAASYAQQLSEVADQACETAAKLTGRDVWVTAAGASAAEPWGQQGQADALAGISTRLSARDECQALFVSRLLEADEKPLTESTSERGYASSLIDGSGRPRTAYESLKASWTEGEVAG